VRALSEALPLRTTAVWGEYREAKAIPHRYGECGGAMLQYDRQRTQFVWADHAVQSVDEVLVGGQPAGNWVWRNTTDSTGQPIALVEFDQPVDEGVDLLARGRGKLHPTRGTLIESPADVLWDMLTNIAGRGLAESQFAEFRAECEQAGIIVGGSLQDSAQAARGAAVDLCRSIGARFAPDARRIAFLWPGGAAATASLATIEPPHVLEARQQHADIVTELTVRYRFEEGEPREALAVEAPGVVARYGRRPAEHVAPWISSARVALSVATRLLQHQARPVWSVAINGIERELRIGDKVTLDHPVLPLGGEHRVIGREYDAELKRTAVSIAVPVGDTPAVSLVRQSTRLTPERYAGVSVDTRGTQRLLTVYASDGSPAAGAAVVLDGAVTRIADGAGRVEFPAAVMPVGAHTLTIRTADGAELVVGVTV